MTFQALLFCQDEKTARLTTQILNELEFTVETQTEPFAAVKKLMAQHFDAVVVDCDNEQNASLLFKGARNSQLNSSSLAVAVVEGQAGVANAFRIGANLVLTKPINVEQAKGTLRVARGLLKKGGETAKTSPAASSATTPAPAPTSAPATPAKPAAAAPTQRPSSPVEAVSKPSIPTPPSRAMAATPVMSKPIVDDVLEVGSTAPEPPEEVLLDLEEQKPAKKTELTPSMKPASLLEAEQATAKPAPQRPAAPVLASGAAAAAPAPAKVPARAPEFEKIGDPGTKPQFAAATAASSAPAEAPGLFSQRSPAPTFGGLDVAGSSSSGNAAKYAIIAVAVIALAAASYFGYTKLHRQSSEPGMPEPQAAQPVASPTASATPEVPSAIVTPDPAPKPQAAVTEKPSAEVRPALPHKSESATDVESDPEVVVKNLEEPRMVKANPAQPASTSKPKEVDVEAPSAIGTTSDDQSALSSIVSSAPVNVPKAVPAPEMLKVSQGVTQGMLLKRVQPIYPHAALQMRIGGSVQLTAVIDKSGNISTVKVLSGDPILAKAAIDAVRQWKYKPYLLDGEAVEIQTQVTVNFKLP
ncbi:MAG TPA: TonB family protein [Terriglobales bacterium]|nr:TonB family protein [Terriglobales bacterium]